MCLEEGVRYEQFVLWSGGTGKFGLGVKMKQDKASRVLPREYAGHSKITHTHNPI